MTFDGGPDESRRASTHQLNINSDVGVNLDVCEGRGRLRHNFPSFRSSVDSQLSRMDSNGIQNELMCIYMQSPRSGWAAATSWALLPNVSSLLEPQTATNATIGADYAWKVHIRAKHVQLLL
jgi:hypothetical protein